MKQNYLKLLLFCALLLLFIGCNKESFVGTLNLTFKNMPSDCVINIHVYTLDNTSYFIYEQTTQSDKVNIDLNAGNYKITLIPDNYSSYRVYPDYAYFQIQPNRTKKLEFNVSSK